MVDLHRALRPAETEPPTPVHEIAARAGRRQRRRAVAATGAMVVLAVVGVVALVGLLEDSTGSPTVTEGAVDGPPASADEPTVVDPAPSVPSTTPPPPTDSATSSTAGPSSSVSSSVSSPTGPADGAGSSTTAATGPGPETTPGLRTETTRTSEWAEGYCFQIDVTNEAGAQDRWQIVLDLGGTVDTVWNATASSVGDRSVFAGLDGYNVSLGQGASTSFGACVTTAT